MEPRRWQGWISPGPLRWAVRHVAREQELECCQLRLFGENNGLMNKRKHHGGGFCFAFWFFFGVCVLVFFFLYLVEPLPLLNSSLYLAQLWRCKLLAMCWA